MIDSITIKTKSIYLAPASDDGFRVLVDRHLPPGITVASTHVDLWLGDIAPSPRLHKWFHDDREKWDLFVGKYQAELDENGDAVTRLFQATTSERITLLFTAKDARYNTAVALKQYLEGE